MSMPIRPGGIVEVYDDASHLCLELDAGIIVEAIAAYIRTARIMNQITAAAVDPLEGERLTLPPRPGTRIELPPESWPRKPPAKITSEEKDRRRQERRRKKRGP